MIECVALSCDSDSAKIFFRQCLPGRNCDERWTQVASKGVNDELISKSRADLMETVILRGRARVSGEYNCTSACTGLSATQRMLVTGIVFNYK